MKASCSALPDDVYYDVIDSWAKSETHDIAPCPLLPDDVIEDIFTRLPASLALQCRGLPRNWAATLSSDAFVDRHLRAANRHGGPRFFLLSWTPSLTKAHAWSPGGRIAPPPPLTRRLLMRDGVTQQCRGLVILKERAHQPVHCVYNPSTGHMMALPRRRLNMMEGLHHHHPAKGRYESFGLGYDTHIKKHKVVRIHYRGYRLPVLSEVYLVDDDSSAGFWRAPTAIDRPEATKPAGWVSSYEPSVFAQGHVHWMAQKQSPHWRVTRRGLIVSFSVADEHFGVVPLPPRVDNLGEYQLTELEGRLCLFVSPIVDNMKRGHRPYDVWSLRDHETGTWDLHCRIDPDAALPEVASFIRCGASPVASLDDGRRILFMSYVQPAACTFAYTPATGDMERLPFGGGLIASYHTYNNCTWPVTLYEESLISPGRPHEEILFSPVATQALCVALAGRPPPPRGLMHLKLVCRSWHAMIERASVSSSYCAQACAQKQGPRGCWPCC